MARAYRAADIVVCRAGAMTTAELCAWGKASVLVPLATAAADPQLYNARALEAAGAAVVVTEDELSGRTLAAQVRTLLDDGPRRAAIAAAAAARGRPSAAADIVSKLLTLPVN
jgi:UDP-N-acetylglucosamine--N-acetylmuramyl-(pentapeptide) pyrophosphoryl-undecaprenol N-acetylglucosamine transferase